MSSDEQLVVMLDAPELGSDRPVGVLTRHPGPKAAIAFSYARSWLVSGDAFALEPRLPLVEGPQYAPGGRLPAVLSDTAPDLWGRLLLERREAIAALAEGRRARRLTDWEFLTGVSDETRMGALRLRRGIDGPFIDDRDPAVPPLTRLRALEAAARAFEASPAESIADPAIALLIAPGSSLGGGRPKANFRGVDGDLWIAKFPSRTDTRDMAACEWVLNELAAAAGIRVPEHRLLALGSDHHTFAARRFDRNQGSRRLYASALTMASRRDSEATSYLEIALAIADHGARGTIGAELAQLFRRVAFNVLTAGRDDHLRNHGFLRTESGWQLAPAFDLNPMPEKPEHEIAIDEGIHIGDIDLVVETAPFYRLSAREARAIVNEVRDALRSWRTVAASVPLGELEIETLSDAIDA